MLSLTIGATFIIASCGHDSADNGRSTAVDSTNLMGKAPVEYSAGQPAQKTDTTQNTETQEMKAEHAQGAASNAGTGAYGNGANTSNTTDKTTTSGSANNGDADGDRKK